MTDVSIEAVLVIVKLVTPSGRDFMDHAKHEAGGSPPMSSCRAASRVPPSY